MESFENMSALDVATRDDLLEEIGRLRIIEKAALAFCLKWGPFYGDDTCARLVAALGIKP